MNKSLNKSFFKILFCFAMIFTFNSNVYARSPFQSVSSGDIMVNCNADSSCVPLCIYNDDASGKQALIGYHYDSNEWEISFKTSNIQQHTGAHSSHVFYSIDSHLPKDDIYDGNSADDWQGDISYSKLIENYKCPSLLYINDNNKLCFENTGSGANNTTGECKLRSGFNSSTDLLKVVYQFSVEYETVAKGTYDGLFIQQYDEDEAKNKYKLEFLHFADSEIKYDASKSAKDNALQNCDYIKQNAEGDKMRDYMKKVAVKGNDYITNYIDPSFTVNAQRFKSRNFDGFYDTSFYNYNALYKLMVKNNDSSGNSDNMEFRRVAVIQSAHADNQSQNQPVFRYIYDLYGNNIAASVNYIVTECGDSGVVIDTPTTNEALKEAKEELGLYVYQDPTISFNDQYDCSVLTDVAGIIGDAYFILEMAGLAILVVLSIADYVKVFLNDNADELNKSNSKFVKRLLIAVVLFLLPAFVNFSLRIFKIEGIDSDHPLCVQISNK